MSDSKLIQRIHASPVQAVFVVAGGGASALAALLGEPGASRTVLDARIPYSGAAMDEFLGSHVESAANEATARALAMAAFQRARALADGPALAGIAATAALATDRSRRGTDRIHLAYQTATTTAAGTVTFERGTRSVQEAHCRALILDVTADAMGCGSAGALDRTAARREWRELLTGDRQQTLETRPSVLFPGSFNPMHEGHLAMAAVAQTLTGQAVTLEISAFNVDKPPIDYIEFRRRSEQDRGPYALTFTNAPTFVEKARIFPGVTFVVGIDTITRIGEPRYYGGPEERDAALDELAELECRFLVFGRSAEGLFQTLGDVGIPDRLAALCDSVPEATFRSDVSSTALRAAADSQENSK